LRADCAADGIATKFVGAGADTAAAVPVAAVAADAAALAATDGAACIDDGDGGRLLMLSGAPLTRMPPADCAATGDEDGTEDEDEAMGEKDCSGSVSGEPARAIAVGVARIGDGDVDEANTTRSRLAEPAPAPANPAIGV
jgi:hypothetical protein